MYNGFWKGVRFGDLIEEFSHRTKVEDEDVLLSAAVEGMFLNTELFGHQRGVSNKGYKKIEYGTLVLSTQNLHLGNANVNLRFEHGMVSPAYKTYRIKNCSTKLLAEWIKSEKAKQFFYEATTVGASVCRRNVEWETLYNQYLYLPSDNEQQRIAEFLSLITEKISKQEQLINSLKKYKRGVINKLINELMLQGSPCNFAELVNIQRGGSPRPIDDYITDDINGINWIKIGDVSADTLYVTKTKERIKPSGVKKSRKVQPGDLILSNSMSFGRPYIMKIDGCIHDGWLLIRDEKEMFDKKFLCYYLASDNVMSQYRRFAAGSCVSNLNSDLVGGLQIVLPPLSEQKKCAAIFEQIDLHILNSVKQYGCLCQFKQGLLQQLFI